MMSRKRSVGVALVLVGCFAGCGTAPDDHGAPASTTLPLSATLPSAASIAPSIAATATRPLAPVANEVVVQFYAHLAG
jgi:hypothetical protein